MHHPVKTSSMMSAPSRGSTSTLVTSRLRLLALSVAVSAALGATVVMAQTDDYAEVNRLMRAGQLSEALSKVDQYLTSKPRDPQMRFLKGVIQTEGGKHSDAIATFSKLTEEFPELPEPYNNLAVLYAGQSQFDKARAALEMAIRTNPSYATAHENLGDVYAKLASQSYSKALQLDAGNFTPPGGQARGAWEADRKARILPRSRIGVDISDLSVTVDGDRASASFKQDYSSDTLNVTSRKKLDFVKSGSRWLIVRESTGS